MPSTLVAMALGGLLAAGLLGYALDRRSVAVVVAAAAAPDLDVFAGLLVEGLHNALLHNVFVPGLLAAGLYYDTRIRATSFVLDRWGPRAVRVGWVAIAAYCFAIGLDLFNVESAAPLYPVHDRFYSIVGRMEFNNKELFLQTFLQPNFGGGPLFPGAARGTVSGGYVVASFLNPVAGPNPENVERVLLAIRSGWELLLVLTSAGVLAARLRLRSWGVTR